MSKSASTLENLCKPPKIIALQPATVTGSFIDECKQKRPIHILFGINYNIQI